MSLIRPLRTDPHTWRTVPVDDLGYLTPAELLRLPDRQLVGVIDGMEAARYNPHGWRNHNRGWQRGMHDGLTGRTILDYGCGVGLEARTLARLGNQLIVADLTNPGVWLAERVVALAGYRADTGLITPHGLSPDARFDVFYANGVLHHIPEARQVLAWAAKRMPADGEMRLLLYTDRAQERADALGCSLGDSLDFEGVWADWYDEAKLAAMLPEGWQVDRWEYITPEGWYATARVVRA